MILTRLFLESFGKYKDTEIKFEPGINLIYGKNEKGKSTIHKFIEAMLFGLNKYRYNIPDQMEEYFHYRPWKNKNEFSGEMDFEEVDSHIHMTRNFLDENGIIVYKNHGILQKADENSEITSEDRRKSLNVLGIANISNKTGRSLVEEMKSRILNIRNANSGIISLDEATSTIQSKIDELNNDSNFYQLKKQLEYYNEKCEESENLQSMKKDFIEAYYHKINEINALNDDIAKLRDNIRGSEKQETLDKYYLLLDKNREITRTEELLKELDPYKDVNVDDVDNYLMAKNRIPMYEEEIALHEESIELAKSKQDRITLEISPRSIKVLSNDEFNISFVRKFQEILKIKNELFDVEQNIYNNEEKLHETLSEQVYSQQEISYKTEKLDKDYFKFMNMVSWKNQIEEEQGEDSRGKVIDDALLILEDKKLNYKAFMLISQIISALSILRSFAKPNEALFMLILFGLGLLGAAIFRVQQSRVKQDMIDQKYRIKNLDEEIIKNKARLYKANEHIGEILALHNCKSEEEFHLYYKEKKLAYENEALYRKELEHQEAKREVIHSEILSEENTVSDFFEAAYLFGEEAVEVDKKTYDKVLHYIQESKKYNELSNSIESLEKELEVAKTHLEEALELANSETFKNLELTNIKDYQDKREAWVRVNESLATFIVQKELILDGEEEGSVLRIGSDLDQMNYTNEGEKEYNLSKLKELVMDKEEKLIKLKRDSLDAKYEAEKIANSQVAHSRIKEKIDELNGQIRKYQERISSYGEVLELILKSSTKIGSRFHDELKETIHHVVSEVIGDTYDVILEDDMRVLAKDKVSNEIVEIENLSMGTIDQIYFALRIGLINSMDHTTEIPLILDDCFVHYDGERLGQMLQQVSELNRQVIMLTCHEREKKIFDELGIKINYIEL